MGDGCVCVFVCVWNVCREDEGVCGGWVCLYVCGVGVLVRGGGITVGRWGCLCVQKPALSEAGFLSGDNLPLGLVIGSCKFLALSP